MALVRPKPHRWWLGFWNSSPFMAELFRNSGEWIIVCFTQINGTSTTRKGWCEPWCSPNSLHLPNSPPRRTSPPGNSGQPRPRAWRCRWWPVRKSSNSRSSCRRGGPALVAVDTDGLASGKHRKISGTSPCLMGKTRYFDWAMFNGYVGLPEGM